MITDARSLPVGASLETDVCIIGAGAAGITLARELISLPFRVCLLEAGGFTYQRWAQDFLDGENVGLPYHPIKETRFAGFGGTTGVWAGWCRPLDPIDFEEREWVPHSGWPFSRAELDPFFQRAQEICGLGAYNYDPASWESLMSVPPLPLLDTGVATCLFQRCSNARLKFGRVYRRDLARAANVHTLLNANALSLSRAPLSDRVDRVRVGTVGGHTFEVAARLFVLAAGGIENARILLLSGEERERGLGNSHGLVGRFFTEHVFINAGAFLLTNPALSLALYFPQIARMDGRSATIRGAFSLTPQILRSEQLLNCAIFFRPGYEAHDAFAAPGVTAMLEIWDKLRGRAVPDGYLRRLPDAIRDIGPVVAAVYYKIFDRDGPRDRWRIRALAECAPNPDSRVTLGTETDAFGRPRVRLDWRLSDWDIESIKRAHATLDLVLRRAGVGRLQLSLGDEDTQWLSAIEGGKHHMGTTRMHSDARHGVVDAEARVHGIPNLYVTGSSVFPTPGCVNPTLTIVALALRLAERLKNDFCRS